MDEIIGVMDNMKNVGENIGEELDVHMGLLDNLDKNVDKNTKNLKKNTGKLDNILRKSSNCCLFVTIFVELLILVILLLY
jgi:hypothetical protein